MATVHRALERGPEGFERTVALKRLLPHLAEDASFIKSFVREAKLASILNHVNIVQIYELGRVGTEYFISMEYIDGRDLRRILRHARKVTGPPPIQVTVGLMLQLCDALDYAHNKVDEDGNPLGLVHRDISPSNLLVTSAGHLKIIDFGIAKAQSSQLRTHTGRVKGKLAYMAPEAISGSRDLDARSDLWACGVILHELLTARPLFASKNEYQTLLKVQRGDILPPSTFNQACPPELDAIVFRALARDPDDRYAGAAQLRDALLELVHQHALHTGYRDIALWIDWAFSLEPPASFSANPDSSGVQSVEISRSERPNTVRPHRTTEEDEAAEVVWGGGNVESEDGPVVLEDVPDVSEKHRRPRLETEDGRGRFDDIPTPLPSHGTMPSIYGDSAAVAVPNDARSSERMRAPRAHTSGPHTIPRTGPLQRPSDPAIPRPTRITSQGMAVEPSERAHAPSHRVRAATLSERVYVPSPRPPSQNEHVRATTQSERAKSPSAPPVPPIDTPQLGERLAAHRARTESGGYVTDPYWTGASRAPDEVETNPSDPLRHRAQPTYDELGTSDPHRRRTQPGAPTDSDLRTADPHRGTTQPEDGARRRKSGTLDGVAPPDRDEPRATGPEPVVRFSNTVPPPLAAAAPPATKLGYAPARAVTMPARDKPVSQVRIGESIAMRAQPRRTWLWVLASLLIAGGTAAVVATMVTRGTPDADPSAQVTRPPVRETGTVRFVLEPNDASIKIGGALAHTGSPWSRELPAGIHQIEIHRSGYKSWLTSLELSPNETQTLRVVLEPLTSTIPQASLTIATTPPGLEVVIDDKVQAQRTPFKATLTPGPHKIVLRMDGVDVWQQQLVAEASSDYEFNPSFTEDKQRERAQRARRQTAPEPSEVATAQPSTPPPTTTAETSPDSATPPAAAVPTPSTAPTPPTAPAPATTAPAPTAATIAPPATTPPAAKPAPAPAPADKPATPSIAQPATPPPATRPTAPRIVPPSAVKRLSGEPPSITKYRNVELPASLAAKVCIDIDGKVTSAEMVTKVSSRVAAQLTEDLRTWRYAPYKQGGAAIPVCFVVSFRVK